jgi:hypothetical protein
MDLQYSIEDRSKHEQRPSSSSKRPRIDPVYSEEAEGVLRQEEQHIAFFSQESSNRFLSCPSDPDRRGPPVDRVDHAWAPHHIGIEHNYVSIPLTCERATQFISYELQSDDEARLPCSPAESHASSSFGIRHLRLTTQPLTPRLQSSASGVASPGLLEQVQSGQEASTSVSQPKKAEIVDSSEFCFSCPLEPVKELPRECVSLKEWGERDGVEDGGHAGVEAMYRVIRRLNNSHSGLQSCCGAFQGAGDVYMSPQSSLDSSFSVFMDPNLPAMRKNLAELKEFEDESEMSKKGRLYDVKGIEGILIFLQDLSKRGKIQVS